MKTKKHYTLKNNNLNIIGIIPARMGSSRFYGKPLAEILGKPMIYHVYQRSLMSKLLSNLYIATPDNIIKDYCLKNNMNIILTKKSHKTASDRASEALLKIEKTLKKKIDIVVLIQGDEPLIYPQMIDLAIKTLLEDENVHIVNLVSPLKSKREFMDPNTIKVTKDKNNMALFFSREPIPSLKRNTFPSNLLLKQVCIIPFRRDFLLKFKTLKPSSLEKIESIDMLRCLENGIKVKLSYCDFNTHSVDTIQDLQKVTQMMKKDRLAQHTSYL